MDPSNMQIKSMLERTELEIDSNQDETIQNFHVIWMKYISLTIKNQNQLYNYNVIYVFLYNNNFIIETKNVIIYFLCMFCKK